MVPDFFRWTWQLCEEYIGGGVPLSILSILSLSFFTFFCEGQCFGDKMDKMDRMGGQNGQKFWTNETKN